MLKLVGGSKALALVLNRLASKYSSKFATTIKCTLYHEITCTAALDRLLIGSGGWEDEN